MTAIRRVNHASARSRRVDASGDRSLNLRLPSPLLAIGAAWLAMVVLYWLDWSSRFTPPVSHALEMAGCVVLGTALGYWLLGTAFTRSRGEFHARASSLFATRWQATATFARAWRLWWVLAALEAVASTVLYHRPVPILLALSGQPSGYLYYGVPSLHGLLLAAGCSLSLMEQAIRLANRRFPLGPKSLIYLGWLFAVLGRKQMVVFLIQLMLLLVVSGRIRMRAKDLLRVVVVVIVAVFAFGAIGGYRSQGASSITEKLQFTGPSWVPDALVWLYAYTTTPLANLTNASDLGYSGGSLNPLTNLSGLIPTVFTSRAGVHQYNASAPWLLSSNFNVSTGYVNSLVSGGRLQIVIYAALIGWLLAVLRKRGDSLASLLAYLAAYQCAIAMIYANNFANLNNVSQIPFLLLVVGRCVSRPADQAVESSARRSTRPGRVRRTQPPRKGAPEL